MRRLAALLALSVAPSISARAHDIPNARVDRSIQVDVRDRKILIEYEVGLSELTLTQDLRALVGDLPGSDRPTWFQRYGEVVGPLNAKGFLVRVGDVESSPEYEGFRLVVDQHPRFFFRFSAPLPASGRLTARDTNYAAAEGTSRLAVRLGPDVAARVDDLPPEVEAIPIRPVWRLSDEEERRTKEVAFDFQFRDVASVEAPKSVPPAAEAGSAKGLSGLLDRPVAGTAAWVVLGLTALLLGATHSLQPGHGKTLAAAGNVGGAHPWRSALILSGSTTLAHMATVLTIALVLRAGGGSDFEALHRPLMRLAGFVVAATGLWRLGRRIGGVRSTGADVELRHRSPFELAALGFAAGLVPCWEAIGLVLIAASVGRTGLGLFLLSWFSLGMGAVLTLTAALAARLSGRNSRPADVLRTGGALVLIAVGLWFLSA